LYVNVSEAVDELPHESVQVLVTEYEPHEPLVVTSAEVNESRTTSISCYSKYWSSRTIDEVESVRQQSLEPFYLVH
jgi:hypothetical protein